MRDLIHTGVAAAVAGVLAAVAILTSPRRTLEVNPFPEQNEAFFPDLDPTRATAIEITTYDEETASAKPFKVERRADGKWVMPTHDEYPADQARDRLRDIAAATAGMTKLELRSDRAEDHEALGVLDPLAPNLPSLKGRGTRVVLRDETGRAIADFIVGKKVEGREGYRFVRLPEEHRTYVAKIEADLTGDFSNWVKTDLLDVYRWDIARIEIDPYRVQEETGRILPAEVLVLTKPEFGSWALEGLRENEETNRDRVDEILDALDDLKIVDVRRKPDGLTPDLTWTPGQTDRELAQTLVVLQQRGFFVAGDGRLVSNEGEIRFWTTKGVKYTLRFGELTGDILGREETRHLLVTAEFDPNFLPEPQDESKREEWQRNVENGRQKAAELRERFGPWSYVIAADTFTKVRATREQLVRQKEDAAPRSEQQGPPPPPEPPPEQPDQPEQSEPPAPHSDQP